MSFPTLSQRALLTPPSPIRKLAPLARKAAERGTEVFYLNIGQPDVPSPEVFFDAVRRYPREIIAYEESGGYSELRKAWSRFFNRTVPHARTVPENFLITTGASEALIFLFMVLCDPGDEVVVFDPTYANYAGFAAIAGVTLVPVQSSITNGFHLPDTLEIQSRISHRTKAVLLCNPNNPTGTVYAEEEVGRLLAICDERRIFLVADETYREFVYNGEVPRSVLSLAPDNPRVLVVDSLSKRFSLCGARIGALITVNQAVLTSVNALAQARLASPTVEQFAAARLLESNPTRFISEMVATFSARRDCLHSVLERELGLTVNRPEGAFYCVVELPVDDAESFCSFMLSDFSYDGRTTFVAPAKGFYMESGRGIRQVRIAYVLNEIALANAVVTLGRGVEAYRKRMRQP